jgi:hypothetical protein
MSHDHPRRKEAESSKRAAFSVDVGVVSDAFPAQKCEYTLSSFYNKQKCYRKEPPFPH